MLYATTARCAKRYSRCRPREAYIFKALPTVQEICTGSGGAPLKSGSSGEFCLAFCRATAHNCKLSKMLWLASKRQWALVGDSLVRLWTWSSRTRTSRIDQQIFGELRSWFIPSPLLLFPTRAPTLALSGSFDAFWWETEPFKSCQGDSAVESKRLIFSHSCQRV